MSKPIACLFVAFSAIAAGAVDDAQGQSRALQQRLAAAKSVDCHFTSLTTGNWEDDGATANVTPADLELSFFDVNVDEGTAEADSRFGASLIVVRLANEYLHLMQMFGAGPLYVTTILAREVSDGRLMAIHTRHEYTPIVLTGFTSRPEMYLGDCVVGD
jgi:hypothetical protein